MAQHHNGSIVKVNTFYDKVYDDHCEDCYASLGVPKVQVLLAAKANRNINIQHNASVVVDAICDGAVIGASPKLLLKG